MTDVTGKAHLKILIHTKNMNRRSLDTAAKQQLYENYKDIISASSSVQVVQGDLNALHKLLDTCSNKLRLLRERPVTVTFVGENEEGNDEEIDDGLYGGEKKQEIPLWLMDVVDDLVTLVHSRNYDAAVSLIEKAREELRLSDENLSRYSNVDEEWIRTTGENVQHRCDKLAEELIASLSNPNGNASDRKAYTYYLIRLELVDAASNIYFASVSQDIRHNVRSSTLQGDSALHVRKLSRIVFGGIIHASEVYRDLFGSREKRMLSAFVKWAAEETKEFAKLLQQQVFDLQGAPPNLLTSENFRILGGCLENAFMCSSEVERCGISLSRQLIEVLSPVMEEKINRYVKQFNGSIKDLLSHDDWSPTQVWMNAKESRRKSSFDGSTTASSVASPRTPVLIAKGQPTENAGRRGSVLAGPKECVYLTKSGKYLYDHGLPLVVDVRRLLIEATMDDLDVAVVQAACTIVGDYVKALNEIVSASDSPLTDTQSIAIIANIMYTASDLLPRIQSMFFKRAPLQVSNLIELQEKTQYTFEQFSQAFGMQRGRAIVQNLRWSKADYSQKEVSASVEATAVLIPVIRYLISLHEDAAKYLGEAHGTSIIVATIVAAFQLMSDERGWKRYKAGSAITIGAGGLHRLLMDIHVMAQCGLVLMADVTVELENLLELSNSLTQGLNAVKERAVQVFTDHGGSLDRVKLDDDAYTTKARAIIKDLMPRAT